MDSGNSLKYFSGEDADYREYKRWKQWAQNKMLVMDKLPKSARGAFVWTLLHGKALEVVEHLAAEQYQVEGGEQVIFELLDKRWPQKDRTDEIGEIIGEIFAMKGKDNESLRQWSARAREAFDRCKRKCGVDFPEEVRGWVLLHCSGLSEHERAVVLARGQGELKFDSVSQSMRSCYPEYVISRRKAAGAHLVEDAVTEATGSSSSAVDLNSGFEDVELLLAEHGLAEEIKPASPDPEEEWEEADAAEVLAASWKSKRAELSKLQKSRKFGQANDLRRAFRVEVEEVKKRSRCYKCQKMGHFARDCKMRGPTSASTGSSSAASGKDHGAGMVSVISEPTEHFVCTAVCETTATSMPEHGVCLISSPGFAVLDSGCGKTIIGEETLADFHGIWKAHDIALPTERSEVNTFKFGNGEREVSHRMVDMPVYIAGRHGVVRAAVVKGSAPLLLSRAALKTLQAHMDFERDEVTLFGTTTVPMLVNEAGQYTVNVSRFPIMSPNSDVSAVSSDVSAKVEPVSHGMADHEPVSDESCHSVKVNRHRDKIKDYWEVRPKEKLVIRHHLKPRTARFTPCNTQCPIDVSDLMPHRINHVKPVVGGEEYQVYDQWTDNSHAHHVESVGPWKGKTVFAIHPSADVSSYEAHSEAEVCVVQWSPKQHRQLLSQIRQGVSDQSQSKVHVVEVFSPPRFALECEKLGYSCISADLCTGWDFRKQSDRALMRDIIKCRKPELLVLCPPCTWAGGWFHLNQVYMSPTEVEKRKTLTRLFILFCRQLMKLQIAHGGRTMFEHPKDSVAWEMLIGHFPDMHVVDLHMCQYGLAIPGGDPIRKPTRLLVSHRDMCVLSRLCPGSDDPRHAHHQVIAGTVPNVGPVSKFAGIYPPAFVKAVLATVKELQPTAVLEVQAELSIECLVASRLEDLNAEEGSELIRSLRKLHANLGHPPNQQLMRVLKHGGASPAALQAARELTCEQCAANVQPKPAMPCTTEFNSLVGIDIKYLTGWNPNQKVPALNIVDYASSMQLMIPLFRRETSELIFNTFMERWVSWAGMPTQVVCDPAQPNVADALTVPLEQQGAHIKITAADAHWQLGKTEVHGGWFNRILNKVITERVPKNQQDWLECVHASHCKNQLIQVYGMTPSQFVFGRNPRIPENMLDEPLEVVPATASLYQEALAKQIATRQAARRAVLELQDSRSLKLALAARPRVHSPIAPGQYVAYWRSQKWVHGALDNQGRWYGPAVVLGNVGRNYVIIHKKQIFRCAPEQIRPSTQSEVQLAETPNLELTGIKNLIDQGAINSKQYVDLLPESYPPGFGDGDVSAPMAESHQPAEIAPALSAPQSVLDQQQQSSVDQVMDAPVEHVDKSPSAVVPSSVFDDEPEVPAGNEHVTDSSGSRPSEAKTSEVPSSYGPMRKVLQKQGAPALFRPGRMAQSDFSEMMREVVPQLLDKVLQGDSTMSSEQDRVEPCPHGTKRSSEDGTSEASSSAPKSQRTQSPASRGSPDESLVVDHEPSTFACDEVAILSVEHCPISCSHGSSEDLTISEKDELKQLWHDGESVEVLMASYLQKKASKEIRGTGNPPELQCKVDEAKLLEWNTILAKNAARLVLGPEAEQVRKKFSHRIMGSRYVMTIKQEDDAPSRVKARWCLQGHLDPDLGVKAVTGDLQSPTLSQVARHLLFQLIVSKQWRLKLGDIKGAFLSAGELPSQYRPLYARLPAGGIPGVPEDALIEVVGHVYGLNDSPSAWYRKLSSVLLSAGFEKSRYDSCLFYMREGNELTGVYGVHVDDCATGGHGEKYEKGLKFLQENFEFRKWRDGLQGGDFCGASYTQDASSGEITMSQSKFIQKLRPIHFSKDRLAEKTSELTPKEVSCLRAVNGSLNWLATQSRPDLATQVSFSQQAFPKPTVLDALAANHAVRRAKQHSDQEIRFVNIDPSKLAVMCHSDAAFANAKAGATQAGYMISFTHQDMDQGKECSWTPIYWKSARLPRVVSSTLSAEAQSMAVATSMCEWVTLLLSEALDGPCFVHSCWNQSVKRTVLVATDCKSLYDHLMSQSSPTLEDRRTAIDIIIIRDCISRLGISLRWLPTDRMLADSLTKESPEAFDLLRACIRSARYQISPEQKMLQLRAQERERRRSFAQKQRPTE